MKDYPVAASGGFAASNRVVAPGFTPCADVRARIIENARKEGKDAFKPTTTAIRMAEAEVADYASAALSQAG